jgi:hypothetical protein
MKSEPINPSADAVLAELSATLRDYQGPGHVRRRSRPARRRLRTLTVVVSAAAIVAATGAIFAFHLADTKQKRSTPAALGLDMIPPLSLEELINRAPVVFVGRVTGSEDIPVASDGGLGICPVHYEVEHSYRGNLGASTDLGFYCGNEHIIFPASPADVGQSYLVFAVSGWSTSSGSRVLAPYSGGIFLVTGAGTAENEANGTVHLDDLAQRLASTQSQP